MKVIQQDWSLSGDELRSSNEARGARDEFFAAVTEMFSPQK